VKRLDALGPPRDDEDDSDLGPPDVPDAPEGVMAEFLGTPKK
jgi:hypothetical protein